ncbi:MAG: CotH kinase family protein [Ignavibacteriae bacterium]|nr:CotH kinase family protein [Ignavibacteriota bacterium]
MNRLAAVLTCACLLSANGEAAHAQTLFINEFMAANSSTIIDPEYHEYADWIELYNGGTTSVNLNGFSITDNLSQPQKYRFTSDVFVPPHGYVIIWADDRGVNNHTNFKLSASGESIGLFSASGSVIDSLSFGPQLTDISYGRCPDGATSWYRLSPASPGAANLPSQIWDKLDPPLLSQRSGFHSTPLSLSVTHPVSGVVLRYTIDGHTPTASSTLYTGPIRIDTTTALRVVAFKEGLLPSNVVTATYFIQDPTQLPVLSLVTDPENFFSDTSGIYIIGTHGIIANCSTAPRNWNQDWERPVELELIEADRQSGFRVACGVKIFGGCARLYPEKSLAFYFRDVYGFGRLHYPLFSDQEFTEYNNFVLRSSGQDWWRTMFRDGMVQTLIKQGMELDVQDYRPSVLFINGQYWGIHNVREKLNEHYVEQHHGVDPENIDLVELSKGVFANKGDLVAYNHLIAFLTNNSPAIQSNYDSVRVLVDINNFIDYTIAEIYAANGDWPGANVKLWRERTATGKWRWMVYDLDFTFGGNSQGQYNTNTLAQATAANGPSWPNPPWATLILRKLLENPGFKSEFIQRFAVHVNTTFYKERVLFVIDSLAAGIASEIPRHKLRWPQSLSIGTPTWAGNIQIVKDFATQRPLAAMGHFSSAFSLGGASTLVMRRRFPDQGKIYTHDIEASRIDSPYVFFKNVPLRIRAVAEPGFRFVRWQGAITSTAAETTIVLNSDGVLSAFFEPVPLSVEEASRAENAFQLVENYPNPFNASTVVSFRLPMASDVRIAVYDMLGREVALLATGRKNSGLHKVTWQANDRASGVYLCRMDARPLNDAAAGQRGFVRTMKMILMK